VIRGCIPARTDGPRAFAVDINLREILSLVRKMDMVFNSRTQVLRVTCTIHHSEGEEGYDIGVSSIVSNGESTLSKLLRVVCIGPLSRLRQEPQRDSE